MFSLTPLQMKKEAAKSSLDNSWVPCEFAREYLISFQTEHIGRRSPAKWLIWLNGVRQPFENTALRAVQMEKSDRRAKDWASLSCVPRPG